MGHQSVIALFITFFWDFFVFLMVVVLDKI